MVEVQSTFSVEAERFAPEGEVSRYRFPPIPRAEPDSVGFCEPLLFLGCQPG